MKRQIKKFLRDRFPLTRVLKAWWVAAWDSLFGVRESYAQGGEDKIILRLLKDEEIESRFYIDVGANHPTKLSNTYRLYREGYCGVTVEPNRGLLRLQRLFRPRDTQLGIGCGERPAVLRFQHAASHVLSGFESEGIKTQDFLRSELVPVLPLDLVTAGLEVDEIAVLSIDVEGFDLQVARGATETLRKTRIVVIEGDSGDEEMMPLFEQAGFRVAERTPHNIIFLRAAESSLA